MNSLDELIENDSDFTDLVDLIGFKNGFEQGLTIFAPSRIRVPFIKALSYFRPIYKFDVLKNNFYLKKQSGIEESVELVLELNNEYDFNQIVQQLISFGYIRVNLAENSKEFSVHGGVIRLIDSNNSSIVLDFFGNSIDKITVNQKDVEIIKVKRLLKVTDELIELNSENLDELEINTLIIIEDAYLISDELNNLFIESLKLLYEKNITVISLVSLGEYKYKLEVNFPEIIEKFEEEFMDLETEPKNLQNKFNIDELEIGDYIVHNLHGIGKYIGKESRNIPFEKVKTNSERTQQVYLVFEYAANKKGTKDYLYVDIFDTSLIQKYIGSPNPPLSKFGGAQFAKAKLKAKKHSFEVAGKLANLYAERINSKGFQFFGDSQILDIAESGFKFNLTESQVNALKEIFVDMEKANPMERLLCGDVGFGKTELALRAAVKAASSGFQVAILSPTTLLTNQHYELFKNRLKGTPLTVAKINRFVSKDETQNIIKQTNSGSLDILIGTHSLFSDRLNFSKLGLLIIDEEQRFGTLQKELLKTKYPQIDILSLSATPIPRTLEMSLSGVRDVSVLETPPLNRKSIITNVLEETDSVVKNAILEEVKRGGQVFLIHNRTSTIQKECFRIKSLVPGVRVEYASAKMSSEKLDSIINRFWLKEIDVLVCTSIIETGIDISNANTLIVQNSEKFGLTSLHQLRGRVGRSSVQAYAFFLYSEKRINKESFTRLETLAENSELGDGTKIALKDLEFRGSGNYLGEEQSGHIALVGYQMYIELLAAATETLKRSKGV